MCVCACGVCVSSYISCCKEQERIKLLLLLLLSNVSLISLDFHSSSSTAVFNVKGSKVGSYLRRQISLVDKQSGSMSGSLIIEVKIEQLSFFQYNFKSA